MKRYYMRYESDKVICGSHDHFWANANTLNGAKKYIKRCRESVAADNPRNFRIYDTEGALDSKTGVVPCVYRED